MIDLNNCEVKHALNKKFEPFEVKSIKPFIANEKSDFQSSNTVLYYGIFTGENAQNLNALGSLRTIQPNTLVIFNYMGEDLNFQTFQGYEIRTKFDASHFTYNLKIAGLGETVNTRSQIASFFDFSEADVGLYKVENGNIYANITNTAYSVNANAFYLNDNLTGIVENAGYLKSALISSFRECPNLKEVKLLGLNNVSANCFYKSGLDLDLVDLPNVDTISGNLSFAEITGNQGKTLVLPKLEVIPSNVVQTFSRAGHNISLPICHSILGLHSFQYYTGVLDMPSLINQMGSNSFVNCSANVTINTNIVMQTINSGSPDANLTYAIGRGATVNYS